MFLSLDSLLVGLVLKLVFCLRFVHVGDVVRAHLDIVDSTCLTGWESDSLLGVIVIFVAAVEIIFAVHVHV